MAVNNKRCLLARRSNEADEDKTLGRSEGEDRSEHQHRVSKQERHHDHDWSWSYPVSVDTSAWDSDCCLSVLLHHRLFEAIRAALAERRVPAS
ncbi:MAG: hypothetical protein ACRDT7_18325, partial [Microbacterium sp.]